MADQRTSHHESNRAFYDRISGAYDLLTDANERQARVTGLKALGLQPGERVLEIGFGTGNEILDLAEAVGAGGRVAGIDVSPGMLAVAQRKVGAKQPATPIDLRVGDARQLPFADKAFDAAYSSFTLELFPEEDLPTVLAEARRVLRDGGRLAVVSMAKVKAGDKPSFLERTYVWMHRHFPHVVDCRPIAAAELVTAAGFRVTKQIDLEIWTMPVTALVAEKPAGSGLEKR
jgi:demethylmenaquinone methyltransferase/2-methoxy-6-polyprenyl-1,4-benzoquinol methylase